MVWRATVVTVVFGLMLSCGPRIRRCTEGCPQDSTCDVATGFCIRAPTDAGVTDAGVRDGGIDAGSDGGSADAGCDLFANTGCPSNERCGVLRLDAGGGPAIGTNACLPRGPRGNGDSCSFSASPAGRFDDCDGTFMCSGADGCRKLCDENHACPPEFTCVGFDFGLTPTIGACVPKCDPVSQVLISNGATCGAGRGCYGYPGADALCATERNPSHVHGTPAQFFLNDCAAGDMPMTFDGGRVCVALCRPAEVHAGQTSDAGGIPPNTCASRGAPNASCRFWHAYQPELVGTPGLNGWGYCSDPAFEQLPPCTSLDAGDHLSYGCGPL